MPRRKMTDEEKIERDRKIRLKREKELLESDLKRVREQYTPEPAYFHEVGDEITYGAWDYTKILEVFDDGKFYKCFSSTTNHNTNQGRSIYSEKEHYLPWYEAGFLFDALSDERLEQQDDIRISYQQRDMMALLMKMVDRYGIDLEPEYQRGNVWTDLQKYSLIESIFKNIDIGKFTVIRRPWGTHPDIPMTPKLYEMLDGKQRLTAIFEYYTGKFMYQGRYFYQLHWRDQHHFKHYNISYAETEPLTNEQKYRYFLKLNTTGTPVDEKHIDKVTKMWENEKNEPNSTKKKN